MNKKKKIFISYKRNIEPDEPIAIQVYTKLSQYFDVFIDQTIQVGEKWADEIEKQLQISDYLIIFISANSVKSEMVAEEVAIAHRLARKNKKPKILPVRLNYTEGLDYMLGAYLNPLQWEIWNNPKDTPTLIENLIGTINGKKITPKKVLAKQRRKKRGFSEPSASAYPIPASPDGMINSHSRYYIERKSDKNALREVKNQGFTIVIKGARQVGKSSLLNNLIETSLENKKKIVHIDFQLIESSIFSNADAFFMYFCMEISRQLGLKDKTKAHWKKYGGHGNPTICTLYMEDCVLKLINQSIVISIDEVDKAFDTPFRLDFFAMLRGWHDLRWRGNWKKFNIILVTSTEPYAFHSNPYQSPFNVGNLIYLDDFTKEQTEELNHRYESPFDQENIEKLFQLLNGHPYLTHKSIYLVASSRMTSFDFFLQATDDRGPFGDHLRSYLFRLNSNKIILEGFRKILKNKIFNDQEVLYRLKGAGLLIEENEKHFVRNNLYKLYFSNHL